MLSASLLDFDSDLPLVFVSSFGSTIEENVKTRAQFHIIERGEDGRTRPADDAQFSGTGGIEVDEACLARAVAFYQLRRLRLQQDATLAYVRLARSIASRLENESWLRSGAGDFVTSESPERRKTMANKDTPTTATTAVTAAVESLIGRESLSVSRSSSGGAAVV